MSETLFDNITKTTELTQGSNLAALLTLPSIGEIRATKIATTYETWEKLLATTEKELTQTLDLKTAQIIYPLLQENGKPENTTLASIKIVSKYDPLYPQKLLNLNKPPLLLWYKGTLPPANKPTVAVVGTRQPDSFGIQVTNHFSTAASEKNIYIVSGLALGIDSIAALSALNTNNPTWAILGQGIETFPTQGQRAEIADQILYQNGGLISETPPHTPVARHLLTQRNRLQTGFTDATFITQTGLATNQKPAGTLHTARYAIEQNKYLIVAVPPEEDQNNPNYAGNMALTNPQGINPDLLHVQENQLKTKILARKPAADLCVKNVNDYQKIWDHITNS